MTRNWIVEHQDHWPVYGRTREEAENEAILHWFDNEPCDFVTAEAWGIVSVRCLKPQVSHIDIDLHPLFDIIVDIVRPPKE
jgi:hypothetical protein